MDPQEVGSTDTTEVNVHEPQSQQQPPADPRLYIPPKSSSSTTGTTDITTYIGNEGTVRPQPSQSPPHREAIDHSSPPTAPLQPQHLPPTLTSTTTVQETVLDEEKIHATIDMSINPADVLSGRGKQSFNHGTLLFSFLYGLVGYGVFWV